MFYLIKILSSSIWFDITYHAEHIFYTRKITRIQWLIDWHHIQHYITVMLYAKHLNWLLLMCLTLFDGVTNCGLWNFMKFIFVWFDFKLQYNLYCKNELLVVWISNKSLHLLFAFREFSLSSHNQWVCKSHKWMNSY